MAKRVRCIWASKKRFLVNPDGQFWPCCYLANIAYQSKVYEENGNFESLFEGHKAQSKHPLITSYNEVANEMNVFKSDIEDILSSEWLNKTLPESWESDDTIHIQCKRFCEVDE